MKKYSKQREALLTLLMSRNDHPTAETLYQDLRQFMPRISLGTVYRNLTQAAEAGVIRRLAGADGIDHFDGDTTEHYHVQCCCCHRIDDIPMLPGIQLDTYATAYYTGEIVRHNIMFYGTCESCLAPTKNKK